MVIVYNSSAIADNSHLLTQFSLFMTPPQMILIRQPKVVMVYLIDAINVDSLLFMMVKTDFSKVHKL